MIITEINAFADLVIKVKNCAEIFRTRWYRGSADLTKFRMQVLALSAKHKQWVGLVRKSGQNDDEELNAMAKMATDMLDEEEKRVRIMQKNPLKRLKQRAFPRPLLEIVKAMEAIVNAPPQHVKSKMEYADLLDRLSLYVPVRLPFQPDPKYVPMEDSVIGVQMTLEDPQGHSVVIVHGLPGIGKTSLVKYLGLYYQDQRIQQPTSAFFPDGVAYLKCGEGAHTNIANLALQLLESLGPGSGLQSDDLPQEREGEFLTRPSSLSKLRRKLCKQRVLVILDDIWEQEVLENFVTLGDGVKYVITSQFENLWPDGAKIKLKTPTMHEARKILAMYTEGISSEGPFPLNIKNLVDQILQEVKFHPLALANIGLGIIESGAQDLEEWRILRDSLRDKLGQFHMDNRPIMFKEAYTLAANVTMHRMVARLEEGEKSLLFLMCLFENGIAIPEVAVKILWCRVNHGEGGAGDKQNYINFRNRLKNKSLIEVIGGNNTTQQRCLAIHKLRALCIQQKYATELKSMVLKVLSSIDDAVLLAMYIAEQFWNELAPTAQLLVRQFQFNNTDDMSQPSRSGIVNTFVGYLSQPLLDVGTSILQQLSVVLHINGDITPSISGEEDVMDLMKRARNPRNKGLEKLLPLLDPCATGSREEQARLYARQIILKFIIQKELDDKSTAQLIKLPHTTSTICDTLVDILSTDFWASMFIFDEKSFSSIHDETTSSLITLLHEKSASVEMRRKAKAVLAGCENDLWHPGILDYESEETVSSSAQQLVGVFTPDADATLWCALAETCSGPLRSRSRLLLSIAKIPGFLERLFGFFRQNTEPHLTGEVNNAALLSRLLDFMAPLSHASSNEMAGAIIREGKALNMVQEIALLESENEDLARRAALLLQVLSFEPDNRERIFADGNDLRRVLKATFCPSALQYKTATNADGQSSIEVLPSEIQRQYILMLSQLALVEEHRERMVSVCPDISEKARHLERRLITRFCCRKPSDHIQISGYYISNICKLGTLLHPGQENIQATVSTSLSLCGMSSSTVVETDLEEECMWWMYRGRRIAYVAMEKHAEVLSETEMLIRTYRNKAFPTEQDESRLLFLRRQSIYLKAMMEDYPNAMREANDIITEFESDHERNKNYVYASALAERGVLKRLANGTLQEALEDFHRSSYVFRQIFSTQNGECLNLLRDFYRVLRQQGFVKHLLGDDVGATRDALTARQLESQNLVRKQNNFVEDVRLIDLPSEYLNFVFCI